MKLTKKKLIAYLLTLVMLVNLFPVSAFADPVIKEEGGEIGPFNIGAVRAAPEGPNVTVNVNVGNVDLARDGSRYFLVVGSNDDVAPYQYTEISTGNPDGSYTFTVDGLSDVNTLFVILKRYEAGETPDPAGYDNHDIVFNMNPEARISINGEDCDVTWSEGENYTYTIGISKADPEPPTPPDPVDPPQPQTAQHTAVIKLGKGVDLGSEVYVVFYGHYKPGPDHQNERHGAVIVELNNATSGTIHNIESGNTFTSPYSPPKESKYRSGDKTDVVVAVYGDIYSFQNDPVLDGQFSGNVTVIGENTSTYNGYPVTYIRNDAGDITIIQIGNPPEYDTEIIFKEDGTETTPSLSGKYYILASTDGDVFDLYAPVSADGNVGSFVGENATDNGDLPGIRRIQIIEYTGSSENPTLQELTAGSNAWIGDGDDMDGFTVHYPETLEPDNDVITFTAESPKRYTSVIQYYDADGTQPANADLDGNYYIVACRNGEPVGYAEVPASPNPSDLVFHNNKGDVRKLTEDLTFEIRKTDSAGATFSEATAGDPVSTLGDYILTHSFDEGSGVCTFTATKADEKKVKVNYFKKGGLQPDNAPVLSGNYYMIASVDGQDLYYAKVTTEDGYYEFTNGTETFGGVPSGAQIRLVEYTGDSSNPTLNELKNQHDTTKLGIYAWVPDDTSDDEFVFKAIETGKLFVRVSTYEADNTTPLVPEEAITGQYYVRVPVREAPVTDPDNPPRVVAYCLQPFTFDPNAEYTDIELEKFVGVNQSAFDNSASVNIAHYFPDYDSTRVIRLVNDGNKPGSYALACNPEYVNDAPPEGWLYKGKDATDDGCNVHLCRQDKRQNYHVRLKFDTTDPSEIDLDGGAYVKVTVEHESSDDTYGFVKLSDAAYKNARYMTIDEENGCTYIDIPITEWKDASGNVLENEKYTGNEKGISAKLAYGPGNAVPSSTNQNISAKDLPLHDYFNAFEVTSYPEEHTTDEYDNYIDVYDVIELEKNKDKFTGYTLEAILNGYNIVTLCPNTVASPSNSGASAFGDGDFLMDQHQMGGILVRGDVIYRTGTGVADSADIPASKPSVVGGYVPEFSNSFFNNRQNNNNGWNGYVGSVNTVVGDHMVNGHPVSENGYTGTEPNGVTIVNDDFVDWDRLQNMVLKTSESLGASGTNDYERKPGEKYTISAGSNVVINYPQNTIVEIDIEVLDENGNKREFNKVGGYVYNENTHQWDWIEAYDYSDIPATVVSNLGTGTYIPPKVTINGKPLTTVEDGSGISLLWNYPNAQRINVTNAVTPEFGHVVAPKAYIDVQGGNNSGCMVGNKVRSAGEGHLYPYTGATLLGFYGSMNFNKTVNGEKPTSKQKYNFTLEQLTPHMTNSEYSQRMAALSGENKEQRVFWRWLQTAENEAGSGENADTICFDDISFDGPGTYYFRVYENQETITNTKQDSRQFLIECKVIQYAVDANHSELRMTDINYYEIDTEKELLHISSSGSGKNASINLEAIGSANDLTWNQEDADNQYSNTGITFNNKVTKGEYYVTFTGTKHLDGRVLRDKEFRFTVTDVTNPDEPNVVTTGRNNANGTDINEILFGQVTYKAEEFPTEGGTNTYTYQITEDIPEDADEENGYVSGDITYDPTVITATVEVTYNPDANVNLGEKYFTHTITYNPANPVYSNTYTAKIETDLQATKMITGLRNTFKSGDTWTFKVTAKETSENPGTTDIPMPEETEVTIEPESGSDLAEIDFGNITFTQADAGRTYVYTITEEKSTVKGVTSDTTKREVTVSVTENEDGTLSLTKTPATQLAPFSNLDKGSIDIDVQKLFANSESHSVGEAKVQLVAVRQEMEPPTPPDPTTADLEVFISWAENRIPGDAVFTVSNGEETLTLNSANNYRATFKNLTIGESYTLTAQLNDGEYVTLTTTEQTTDPISEGTNTISFPAVYAPENTKDLTVSIDWSGETPPAGVDIVATTEGKSVTLNSGNNWTADIKDLTIGHNYSVQLTVPENSSVLIEENPLSKQIENNDNNELVFSGSYQGPSSKQDLNFTIHWDSIPKDVSVEMHAVCLDGSEAERTVTLNKSGEGDWVGTIPGLTIGKEYQVYGVVSGHGDLLDDPQTIKIKDTTNTLTFIGQYFRATLKILVDWDNTPEDATVHITASNGTSSREVELDKDNDWTASIDDLDIGDTYTVEVTSITGADKDTSSIINSSREVTLDYGTTTVQFEGMHQAGGGIIPVEINWNKAPEDVTVVITAVNQRDSSDVRTYSLTGTGTHWTGTITGLAEGTNYILSCEAVGERAHGVDALTMSNSYVYVGNDAVINGRYHDVEPIPEGKILLTVIKQDTSGNTKITVVDKQQYNAGTIHVSVTVRGDGAPAHYSATNGVSGNIPPQNSQHTDTIDFVFESGSHTITIDSNWGADAILNVTVSDSNQGGRRTDRYGRPIRYIASTGWPDVSFSSSAPSVTTQEGLKTLDELISGLQAGDYELVGSPVTLNNGNGWYYQWKDLPEYYKDEATGKEYELHYYVVEISADATESNDYSVSGNTTEITNTERIDTDEEHDSVKLNKKDKDGRQLSGAVFGIFANESGTGDPIATYTTDASGKATISTSDTALKGKLPAVSASTTLYVIETTPPVGFDIDTTPHTLVISADSREELGKNDNGEDAFITITSYTLTIDEGTEIDVTDKQKTTDITVEKSWANADGTTDWPEGITVDIQLMEKVGEGDATAVTDGSATLKADHESHTFEDLPTHKLVDGQMVEISYSVEEVEVAGYTSVSSALEDGKITVTNTQDTTDITVEKSWANADGTTDWPEGITVDIQLMEKVGEGDAAAVTDGSATLKADHESHTFEDLPTHKLVNGQMVEISYSVEEVEVAGYKSVSSALEDGKITVTNTQDTTDITVEKSWANADGTTDWPTDVEVEIQLTADGEAVDGKTLTLNAANPSGTFEDLPTHRNVDGTMTAIEYDVEEASVAGYTTVMGALENGAISITNTQDTTEATVKKVWDDSDNQDGKRPESLTVTLSDGTEVTLNEDNEWTATITGLPKYADGEEIEYTWTESGLPEGYTLTDTYKEGTITTLTNTHTAEETEATVKKAWNDSENQDGIRPESLTVTLSNGTEVTLNEENGWEAKVEDLPKYEDGEEIEYTWTERDMPEGYTLTDTSVNGTITTLTNTHETEKTEATVMKVWVDDDNRDGVRPLNLTVFLLADEKKTDKSVTLSAENNWYGEIKDLPKCADGKEIKYTWAESETGNTAGYTLTDTRKTGTMTILTNTYSPKKTKICVEKVWVDDGTHPNEITVQLYANGIALEGKKVTLNEKNGWKYTWKDLCVNENKSGAVQEIKYSVHETEIPDGYVSTVTGNASKGFKITNTSTKKTGKLIIEKKFDIEEPEKPGTDDAVTSVEVIKIWDDNDDKDGNRPGSITVHLFAGGKEIRKARLTAENDWKYTFGKLPKYVNGKLIQYSVTEDPAEWYTAEIHENTIVNRYKPELTSATVRKVWDDNGNEQKTRPKQIIMKLSNGMAVVLSAENGWTATIDNLPIRINGQPVTYTWTEVSVLGYVLESKFTNGIVTTFTNKPWKEPDTPEQGKKPKKPGEPIGIEEYDTPLGVEIVINHVGDCFD